MKLIRLVVLALLCWSSAAIASTTVTVIIPFAPGGGVDAAFRNLQRWAETKSIILVPQYRPGAEGSIAMNELVTGDAPIALVTSGVLAYYKIKEPENKVKIITGIRTSVMVMVGSERVQSLEELNTLVQTKTAVNFGYGAPAQRMIIEQYLERVSALKPQTLVPYKGAGPVIKDLLGNHVDVAVVPLGTVKTQISADKLRLLAVMSGEYGNTVPVLAKQYSGWQEFDGMAIVAGPKTSQATIDMWKKLLQEYLNDPDVQRQIVEDSGTVLPFGTVEIEQTVANNLARMQEK